MHCPMENRTKEMKQKCPTFYFAIKEKLADYCVLLNHVKRMLCVRQILFLSAEVEQRPNDEAILPFGW